MVFEKGTKQKKMGAGEKRMQLGEKLVQCGEKWLQEVHVDKYQVEPSIFDRKSFQESDTNTPSTYVDHGVGQRKGSCTQCGAVDICALDFH